MQFEDIEKLVIQWGIDRDLYSKSNIFLQNLKLIEEFNELQLAIARNNKDTVDAIGDMLVVLTHIAAMKGVNLTSCYTFAYNQIKNRKGKMVNGVFVKEG